ncbi:MAG: hypothetical protein P8R42_19375 [Candidatus Binatia bacterium]|nr:hypothetical protein [Candidatus Binatia bacterium]
MQGRDQGRRRWIAALGALALFAVFTPGGVVHEYDHSSGPTVPGPPGEDPLD